MMNSKPSLSMDRLSQRFDKSLKLDTSGDNQSLALGESELSQPRRGSIRGFLNRAHNPFKSKSRTSRGEHAGETSTFHRLYRAVSSKKWKHGPSLENGGHSIHSIPTPGTGNDPPLIPESGGTAARANAAASNFYWQNRSRPFGNLEDNQGDRESGIGIATAASTASFQQEVVEPDSVTRIDFLQQLPDELASQILSHLDLRSLLSAGLVSRYWSQVSQDRLVWRDVFCHDKSVTVHSSQPIVPGTGQGLPDLKPAKDWKKVYKIRRQLEQNWKRGINHSIYLHGHRDSIYCVQFDEYV